MGRYTVEPGGDPFALPADEPTVPRWRRDPALVPVIDGLCQALDRHLGRVLTDTERAGVRRDDWPRVFQLMLTRDGIPPHQITVMIEWVSGDRFWARNIRSARKLRQKWPRLAGEPGYQQALHGRAQRPGRPARPMQATSSTGASVSVVGDLL